MDLGERDDEGCCAHGVPAGEGCSECGDGPWHMFAGRADDDGFRHIGNSFYVRAYGHVEVVPVLVTESVDGPFYGWIADGNPPCMIQKDRRLYTIQFPAGADKAEADGVGRTARLTIEERPAA